MSQLVKVFILQGGLLPVVQAMLRGQVPQQAVPFGVPSLFPETVGKIAPAAGHKDGGMQLLQRREREKQAFFTERIEKSNQVSRLEMQRLENTVQRLQQSPVLHRGEPAAATLRQQVQDQALLPKTRQHGTTTQRIRVLQPVATPQGGVHLGQTLGRVSLGQQVVVAGSEISGRGTSQNALLRQQSPVYQLTLPKSTNSTLGAEAARLWEKTRETEVARSEVQVLREIAEREAINRFTTAEVKVDMTGMNNHISSNMDIDGFMNVLTGKLETALRSSAQGVHA